MKKPRRFRISCFGPDVPLNTRPLKHFAPRTQSRSDEIFWRCVRQIPANFARVVQHQGNLKHEHYKIYRNVAGWSHADDLTFKHTVFRNFDELLDARGYFPSLNVAKPGCLELAELYDQAQSARTDARRAFRYAA